MVCIIFVCFTASQLDLYKVEYIYHYHLYISLAAFRLFSIPIVSVCYPARLRFSLWMDLYVQRLGDSNMNSRYCTNIRLIILLSVDLIFLFLSPVLGKLIQFKLCHTITFACYSYSIDVKEIQIPWQCSLLSQ